MAIEFDVENIIRTTPATTVKRRGRYQKQRRLSAIDAKPEERLAVLRKLREQFIAESQVKSEAGRAALAETLATLLVTQAELAILASNGRLSSEDMRALASIATSIRRYAADL